MMAEHSEDACSSVSGMLPAARMTPSWSARRSSRSGIDPFSEKQEDGEKY